MKFLLNSLLAKLAAVLFLVLAIPLYVFCLVIAKNKSQYQLNIGISIDQLGNVVLGPLMNILLKKKGGHLFGNPDETISFVLGQNKESNTLTWFGRKIANLLNSIDENHVEKAKS